MECNGVGIGMYAQVEAARGECRVVGDVEQMLEGRAALKRKKSLRGAHALGGSAGENYSGKHEKPRELLGFDWVRSSKLDFLVSGRFHIAANGHKFRDDADCDFLG